MQDQFPYLLVFSRSGCRDRAEMLVVSASVDMKDTAECLDVMLETQLMYGGQSLPECGVKMAIVFLR